MEGLATIQGKGDGSVSSNRGVVGYGTLCSCNLRELAYS